MEKTRLHMQDLPEPVQAFAFRMPTSSHRGIHQKISPSGIDITTINAITHSIAEFLRGDEILVSRLLIRAAS